MFLLINCLIVNTLAAACSSAQANCVAEKCEMIGETEICTQCQTGKVPINGVCEAAASNTKCKAANGSADADQTCKTCLLETFMYKGGCYEIANSPGSIICSQKGAAGICQTCKADNGYFKNPDAANNVDSCISCGDATGVAIGSTNTKTYKGVAGCAKCDPPAQITESTGGTKEATCTECSTELYLKTVTQVTSCIAEAACKEGNTHFPMTDSADSNKKKCLTCSTADKGGIEDCAKCSLTASSTRAGAAVTCTECTTKKLSPLKDACLTDCPAGTYAKDKVCTSCHASCASCQDDNAESSCTACYPGSVLNQGSTAGKGPCIKECTGRYAENCEKDMCTAVLGGSKYCSKCKSGYVPVDGLCVSAGTTKAAPTGCTPGTDGTCSACKDAYFLQSGGCYLSTAYPGNTLCSQATTGKCTKCANGQTADSGTGSCPACDSTCKTCTTANDPTKCSACFPGYYLDSTAKACKKCSETSGDILGVDNCISCDPPSGNQGSVTCYVKTSGGGSSDNSTGGDSGPNLSSGAIAGISVAVIVVVGGLVGFLCWWFVCRGKA